MLNSKEIKTIDLNFLEWFDKVNGNSYNAGEMILNYGMLNEESITFPYAYGYGEFYKQRAATYLKKLFNYDKYTPLWIICKDHNIILRTSIRDAKK